MNHCINYRIQGISCNYREKHVDSRNYYYYWKSEKKENNNLDEIIIDDDIDQPFFRFMQERKAHIVWGGENILFCDMMR